MSNAHMYNKKSTAEAFAAKLTKGGKTFEVKANGSKWQVVEVIASAVTTENVNLGDTSGAAIITGADGQPVINPDLGGHMMAPEDTAPVEQSLSAPATDTSAQALVTFMVQPAKITSEYVIVKAGPLGKERWFQLSRLYSATKIDETSVTIVCTRAELVSRGLKELAAGAPVFNPAAAAAEGEASSEQPNEQSNDQDNEQGNEDGNTDVPLGIPQGEAEVDQVPVTE